MPVSITGISISEQYKNFRCVSRSPCIRILKEFIPDTDTTGELLVLKAIFCFNVFLTCNVFILFLQSRCLSAKTLLQSVHSQILKQIFQK